MIKIKYINCFSFDGKYQCLFTLYFVFKKKELLKIKFKNSLLDINLLLFIFSNCSRIVAYLILIDKRKGS
jgi:hypothetical protein